MRGKDSKLGKEFIDGFRLQNKGTADAYETRLGLFNEFLNVRKKALLDDTVKSLQPPNSNQVYPLLQEFVAYMVEKKKQPRYQNLTLKTVRMFLETYDVEIIPTKFRLKVRIKKAVDNEKTPLTMSDLREIIKACENIRLKTFVMFLAATGMRAREATQIKVSDLHLDGPKQSFVKVRAETTKTGKERDVFLTKEIVQQLSDYLNWKYRERKTQYDYTGKTRKTIHERFKPEKENSDYVFTPYHHNGRNPTHPRSVYIDLDYDFTRLLERIGKGKREENNPKRHEITFHSFRRFVKTEISRLGHEQFSEYFIGHTNSTYWRESEEKKIETFRKVEPSLTYLDVQSMEAREQDVKTQLDDKEERIRSLEKKLAQMDEKLEVKHDSELLAQLMAATNSELLLGELKGKLDKKTYRKLYEHYVSPHYQQYVDATEEFDKKYPIPLPDKEDLQEWLAIYRDPVAFRRWEKDFPRRAQMFARWRSLHPDLKLE